MSKRIISFSSSNLKLNRQFQFAQLCKMLATYGIRDSNLADLSRIEVFRCKNFILKKWKPFSFVNCM